MHINDKMIITFPGFFRVLDDQHYTKPHYPEMVHSLIQGAIRPSITFYRIHKFVSNLKFTLRYKANQNQNQNLPSLENVLLHDSFGMRCSRVQSKESGSLWVYALKHSPKFSSLAWNEANNIVITINNRHTKTSFVAYKECSLPWHCANPWNKASHIVVRKRTPMNLACAIGQEISW